MLSQEVKNAFLSVIENAYKISLDTGKDVEKMLEEGKHHPLSEDEERRLLTKVLNYMRGSAEQKGDHTTLRNLRDVNTAVEEIISKKMPNTKRDDMKNQKLHLITRNGIEPSPVRPNPRFHMREVPMNSGFVKTTDINLWEDNVRLDIHLGQFKSKYGRRPNSDELLQIMLSKVKLPGLESKKDEFDVKALADSIAVNGVRVPPIIDVDGKLLDGNRRVTACYLILNSDDYDSEQKRKVEYLYVWQLTDHATNDDRHSVIVSLNFEADLKKPWPDYVKAWKVYDEWQSMLLVETRRPGPERELEMRKQLAKKFALKNATDVARYIRMVEWATSFEDYFITGKDYDSFEVKHKANEYFQYFDELSKSPTKANGIGNILDRDERLKRLAFELLYQDKYKNWSLVRNLKYVTQDVYDQLVKALDMPGGKGVEGDEAREYVEDVLNDAKAQDQQQRLVGANQRIKSFVEFLEAVPIGAFDNPDDITTQNLQRLLDALELAERVVRPALIKRLQISK